MRFSPPKRLTATQVRIVKFEAMVCWHSFSVLLTIIDFLWSAVLRAEPLSSLHLFEIDEEWGLTRCLLHSLQ